MTTMSKPTWAQQADAYAQTIEAPSLADAARDIATAISYLGACPDLGPAARHHVLWASAHIRAVRKTLGYSCRTTSWCDTPMQHLWRALERLSEVGNTDDDNLRHRAWLLRAAEANLRVWWRHQQETP